MALRVVGAGLGRTGTHSLKLALEKLLGQPCYHMIEVFPRPEHVATWHAAIKGQPVDWDALFDGFGAAVDWPAGAFWEPLSKHYPDALILLSLRDADSWWRSADRTIFEAAFRRGDIGDDPWRVMSMDMMHLTFDEGFLDDPDGSKAAFDRWNEDVRRKAPPDRLLEWRVEDGWEPICERLALPVPDEPFPHVNSTEEFRSFAGLDG